MKAFHPRTGKEVKLANALTFMASDREIAEAAFPGDVIGIHNHGTISIGDTFTEGEPLAFTGIPTSRRNCSAAPACATRSSSSSCRRAWPSSGEEGATQFFRPMMSTTWSWARWACCSSTSSPTG